MKKIKILFFSLFLIFCMSSSVFASDLTMTTDMAQNIIDYFKENINLFYNESLQTEANINRVKGYLNNLNSSEFANSVNSNFLNVIKNNSRLSQTTFENITMIGIVESNCLNLYLIVSNCSYPKDMNLDYMYFKQLSVNNRFQISNYKGDNDYGIYKSNVKITSDMVWSQYPGFITYESSMYQPYVINLPSFNEDDSIMYLPGVLSLAGVQEVYSNFNNDANYYILGDTINGKLPIVPDVPSGDVPGSGDNGESGDTGGTVTPSGDTPGTTTPDYTEQLGNIQTGITNIDNKIPTSGDIENATSSGVVSGNKEYWGSSVDASSGDFEDDVNGIISDIMNNASGEISSNEVFDALNNAEAGFLEVISGQAEDFKISWQDVNYMGQVLIPAGEVNFSQIARDIEIVGTVKMYLNIITSAMLGLSLLKYIYNLILSTMGIDNNYLYESNSQEKEATETVSYTTNIKTGKTIETRTRRDGNTRFTTRREI